MKKVFASIGLITAFMAIYVGLQFWYSMMLGGIIGIQKAMDAAMRDEAVDAYAIGLAVQEALIIHLPIAIIVSASLAAPIYYFICRGRKLNFFEVCYFKKIDLLGIALFSLTGVALFLFNTYLISFIIEAGFLTQAYEELAETFAPLFEGPVLLSFIAIAIAAPLIEEVIFRGLILSELRRYLPVWAAILIQAILFGLIHFNLVQLVFTVIMGVILGLLVVWTKSVWGAVLIHALNNAASYAVTRFEWGELLIHSYILLPLSIAITLSIMFIYWRKHKDSIEVVQSNN